MLFFSMATTTMMTDIIQGFLAKVTANGFCCPAPKDTPFHSVIETISER